MKPSIENILQSNANNFKFIVIAYRKLSAEELKYALGLWLKQNNYKNIPKNKTVRVISTLGDTD